MTESPNGPSSEQMSLRVAELEQELAQVRSERDRLQLTLTEWVDEVLPTDPNWRPPAPADTVRARDHLATLLHKHGSGTL